MEERCLGTGTFGTVMLFENKVSLLTLYTPLSVYKFSILHVLYTFPMALTGRIID